MAQRSAAQPLYGNVRARCGAAPQAGLRAAFALEKDYGRITLLDKRIVTRRYGQAILDALPPFERVFEA